MIARVAEPLSIAAAGGWWLSTDAGSSFSPVTCWVLCLVVDESFKKTALEKVVVGIAAHEVDLIVGIVPEDRRYYHETEFKLVGEELI